MEKQEVGVNYWDAENNVQAGEGKVTVDADANNVNTSALTDVPEGYELVTTGDVAINGGWIFVEVRPVEKQEVGVNYWDAENNVQAGEGKVTVDADANNVNTSALTDVPEGYELVTTGDVAINGGWIFVEVRPVEKQEVGVNYWDAENNVQAGEGKVTVDAGANNVNTSALTDIPEGYELVNTGDIVINDGWIFVEVRPVAAETTIVNVVFVDENGKEIGGGDFIVDKDGDGIFNYSELTLPVGYELVESGDAFVSEETFEVKVQKIVKGSIINVVYMYNGQSVGGGDFIVDEDGDGIFNYSELTVPEGYKLEKTGDDFVKENETYFLNVDKIVEGTKINVVFVDENNNNLGGGDFIVDKDGDGIANYSELDLPVGYKLVTLGDFFVNDYKEDTLTVTVEKIQKGTIINVVYKDAVGNNLGGGDFVVDVDGDGVANYGELPLPEGYKLVETGDFFVKEGESYEITLDKIVEGTIINVVYTCNGENLGGGDFIVDKDGDGVANYSELVLPAGYELIETGDFFVEEGKSYTIELQKIEKGTIINVVYTCNGENLGGGDFIVDKDGDGIANYSELDLPVGYKLAVTGDFFVEEGKSYVIELQKEVEGTIINVVYTCDGQNLGGGDFIVDKDGDGIANYSELDLPVGYELVVTGDFFVEAGKSYTVELQKIVEGTIINVVYTCNGENLGGGDFVVDKDGDGVANYSELDLPVGYELVVTGDFFVEEGKTYTIELQKIMEGTIINVVYTCNGENLGGGDFVVDKDGDGVANYSELDLPVGYELVVTGDFFVEEGKTYTIELQKIMEGTIINVVYTCNGENLGGGDFVVDKDGDGIANYSELDLPVGYELVVTGDFFVEAGKSYTIELRKIAETEETTDPSETEETTDASETEETTDASETEETTDSSKETTQNDNQKADTPKTGDNAPIAAAAGVMTVAAGAVVAILNKKFK